MFKRRIASLPVNLQVGGSVGCGGVPLLGEVPEAAPLAVVGDLGLPLPRGLLPAHPLVVRVPGSQDLYRILLTRIFEQSHRTSTLQTAPMGL